MVNVNGLSRASKGLNETVVNKIITKAPLIETTAKGIAADSIVSKDASAAASTVGKSMVKYTVNSTTESADRWSKAAEEYIPTVKAGAKDTQIKYHHDINSNNMSIRNCLDGIRTNSFTETVQDDLPITIRSMYRYDKEFSHLTPLEKDCIAYRGRVMDTAPYRNADFEIIEKAKPGDIIIPDTAYSYCAFDESTAEHFCPRTSSDTKSIMYKIRLPKGAKVSRNLEHGGEVLMPRGAEYRLISKTQDGNRTNVVLEYLIPTRDNVAEVENLAKRLNIPLIGSLESYYKNL